VSSCPLFSFPRGPLHSLCGSEAARRLGALTLRDPRALRSGAGGDPARLARCVAPGSAASGSDVASALAEWGADENRAPAAGASGGDGPAAWAAALVRAGHVDVGEVSEPPTISAALLRARDGATSGEGGAEGGAEGAAGSSAPAGAPVWMAVRGTVYDVSPGRNFYGPGGAYSAFAGRRVARALALFSTSAEDCTDDETGLTRPQVDALTDWIDKLGAKYDVVGTMEEGAPLRV